VPGAEDIVPPLGGAWGEAFGHRRGAGYPAFPSLQNLAGPNILFLYCFDNLLGDHNL